MLYIKIVLLRQYCNVFHMENRPSMWNTCRNAETRQKQHHNKVTCGERHPWMNEWENWPVHLTKLKIMGNSFSLFWKMFCFGCYPLKRPFLALNECCLCSGHLICIANVQIGANVKAFNKRTTASATDASTMVRAATTLKNKNCTITKMNLKQVFLTCCRL